MVVYIVSKPGITNLSRGIYTNRSSLYKDLVKYAEKSGYQIQFDGIIGFATKKFNYNNFTLLLSSINNNESFGILMSQKDKNMVCEVCKMPTNTLLLT